jgi:hypothetical protein
MKSCTRRAALRGLSLPALAWAGPLLAASNDVRGVPAPLGAAGGTANTGSSRVALPEPKMPRPFTAVMPEHVRMAPIAPGSLYAPYRDLRPAVAKAGIVVRNQGARPTCSVFAMTFLLEYVYRVKLYTPDLDLSEEYLNRAANLANGTNSDGDFFDRIHLGYAKFGIVPEALMPYLPKFVASQTLGAALVMKGKQRKMLMGSFLKPWNPDGGASEVQLAKVLKYLDIRFPVAGGFWWPRPGKWQTRKVGGVELMVAPPASQKTQWLADGHSVALVGYYKSPGFPGGGYFIFRNSLGADWGDQGHGYMPFEYVRNFANDLILYTP